MDHSINKSYIDQLRTTLGRIDQSLSYIDESILWIDDTGTIEWCNHVFSELTEHLRAEVLGNNIDRLITLTKDGATFSICTFTQKTLENTLYREKLEYTDTAEKSHFFEFLCYKPSSYENKSYAIIVLRDITEKETMMHEIQKQNSDMREINKKLTESASYDPVTNLPNRRYLQEMLNRAIKNISRSRKKIAVLFVNIDSFKRVNEQMGHEAGDKLLKLVAERLKKSTRASDFVARLGGDEFIVLLENIDNVSTTLVVTNSILNKITQSVHIEDEMITLSVSIGIVTYPSSNVEEHAILKYADQAMQQAKQKGGNQYCFYSDELNQIARERALIERHLGPAIDNDELSLRFQKQLDLKSNTVHGFEVLLRWKSPELGQIPPALFVEIAEGSRIIHKLDHWVFDHACKHVQMWHDTFKTPMTFSINISAQELREQHFAEYILKTINKYAIPKSAIIIEITETSLINNINKAEPILNFLHNNEIKIAIDDFGTGYSSFHHLIALPISVIKIDLIFVRDMFINEKSFAVCKSIIKLGKALNCLVVAEGVETKQQYDTLAELGCDIIQGFYVARPQKFQELSDEQ